MSNKNVYPIKIKVVTNVNKESFELKYSNIYDPEPSNIPRRILISNYPYFTADVKYDEKLLASKTYSEILNIFFDKQEFIKTMLKDSDAIVKPTNRMKNANANIMTMLKLIFPTSYPTKNNINTSYKKYLLKQVPDISFDISDIKSMFLYGNATSSGKHNYSYLKTTAGICTVSEVIWLNDVLNNQLYRDLIEKLIEYNEWRKKQTKIIDDDVKTATDQLQYGLTPTGTAIAATPATKIGDLIIDEPLQNELASQKRIYNPDDIKQDMIKIIKKHLNIDYSKALKFDEELGKMVDYFINKYLKDPKETPITQLVRFKDKFNFTYVTQDGISDLFYLHKRYDGEDKPIKINKLNEEKRTKEIELDHLTNINGHINNRNWILSKPIIEQYLQNFELLNVTASQAPTIRGKKSPPSPTEIADILRQNINFPPESDYDYITLLPDVKYRNADFFRFILTPSALNERFIDQVRKRISEISPDKLELMDTRIKQLTVDIENINATIAKIGQPLEEIFVFKNETDTTKASIPLLKKYNATEITKMQDEIFKYVITRYNRFRETKSSAKLTGQYVEIDTSIDTIIDKINSLNALVQSSKNNLDDKTFVDQILNITEPIKNSFDKLFVETKISISRKIGEKLAKIIKLSNQIKFLTQFKTIFFTEPATGILIEYEKTLDTNDSFTKLAIDELKQEKYSNLKKIIDFVKNNFLKNNFVSLNNTLNKILKEYFENKNNEFYDRIVEPANKLLNLGEQINFKSLEPLWDVSVTSVKTTTGGTEYDISVYMDVIEGELNAQNISEIKCQFSDEELTRRFEELMDETPVYGPGINTKVFSVKKAKEEREKHEKKKKDEIVSALNSKAKRPITNGGKNTAKSYKHKTNKQNLTKKLYC